MTQASPRAGEAAGIRSLTCARCGAAFTCDLSGRCWCDDESVRLPLPAATDNEDCLCRNCLRAAAAKGASSSDGETPAD
ncbi:MAG TPA: cysteine-rich CWC family protein [Xanthobacteraceae bacterium]|nr:cysteine-rich CWC family protein [Xanthobacteraceae bacterium]